MSITSEQAKVMNARPRIGPVEEEQMVAMWADGASNAEVHERFPEWSEGTLANKKTKVRDRILDLKRARVVELADIPMSRLPARVQGLSDRILLAKELTRRHLETCWQPHPVSGETVFMDGMVDYRKLDRYANWEFKADRLISELQGELKVIPDTAEGGVPVLPEIAIGDDGAFYAVKQS